MNKTFENWYEEQTSYLREHPLREVDEVKWFIKQAWKAGQQNMKEKLQAVDNLTKQREKLNL